ncbi:MAG TPA: hypothetical protein VNU95_09560 [Candidatus Acidoferrales bacterium]|nr:hypothetical protein [Candidatus Acidoferrales bacterium]
MTRRPYQEAALAAFIKDPARVWALLWERQSGKSTTLADFALYEMLRHPGRTVIYASASLLLAQEITLKTATRANQSLQQLIEEDASRLKQFVDHAQSLLDTQTQAMCGTAAHCLNQYCATFKPPVPDPQAQPFDNLNAGLWPATTGDTSALSPFLAPKPKLEFKTFDSLNDREVGKYDLADFTSLFRQQRLEFRVYHSPTCYSRMKVIAPNIATARSWSGTVLLDEVAFIRNLRELMNALLPVITADKSFKLILSTTPPEFDDTHYSFELLAPAAGAEFAPASAGNWYTSESGIRVHRADAFDTALAGKKIFDLKSGAEITPAEAFQRAPNKDGHRIAHWLTWMLGGSAACDLLRLRTAQERGIGQCQNFQINSDADMTPALNWLSQNVGGKGFSAPPPPPPPRMPTNYDIYQWNRKPYADPAYEKLYLEAVAQNQAAVPSLAAPKRSEGGSSKLAIGVGFDVATSTKGKSNPSVVSILEEHGQEWIVRCRFIWKTKDPEIANQRILSILNALERRGIRPRALAQDATNERYYAEQNRKYFRAKVPVVLVVASEAVDKPSLDKPTNWKEYLGHQLIAKLDDNNLTLPPDEYTRTDYRLVMKDRGWIVCEPNDQGMHGDCFDADKLAGHALGATSSRRTIVPPRELWPEPPPPSKLTC